MGAVSPPPATAAADWLVPSEVPRLRWDDPQVRQFLTRGQPVVLTGGCPLVSNVLHWSLDFLRDAERGLTAMASDQRPAHAPPKWPVHFTPRRVRSVRRTYGRGVGEGGIREMSLDAFIATLATEHGVGRQQPVSAPRHNYYLQALLAWAAGGRSPELERRSSLGPSLDEEVGRAIGWDWLRQACATVDGGAAAEACQLWASHGGVSTPLHFDGSSNFVAQVRGTKRFALFHPGQAFHLYPFPIGHPLDNFSMCEIEAPDLARFPALARARGQRATLEAGDVLFLPRYTWHHVEQPVGGRENLSLNFWVAAAGGGVAPAQHEWLSTRGLTHPRRVEALWVGRGGAQRVRDELCELLPAAGSGAAECSHDTRGAPPWAVNGRDGEAAAAEVAEAAVEAAAEAVTGMASMPDEVHEANAAHGANAMDDAADEVTIARYIGPHGTVSAMSGLAVSEHAGISVIEADGRAVAADDGSGASHAAVRLLHAARMAESAALVVCGDADVGGRWLRAVACGGDEKWPASGAAKAFAIRLREEVARVLADDAVAAAVLRLVTRHGRLHLAPPVEGPVVASERGDMTSDEELERLFGIARPLEIEPSAFVTLS